MTCSVRFKAIVTTHLLLLKGDLILLSLRQNTGYGDGLYSVISGTLEGLESVKEATLREAFEEAGVKVLAKNLKFTCTMHCLSEDNREFIEFFFTATEWEEQIVNREEDKCRELKFFHKNHLPKNIIPYVARGIECTFNHITYDEFGWRL